MNYPTNEQLREWWKQEQEFMDTPFGRQWYVTRYEAQRLQMEHAHYRKLVLDDAERQPTSVHIVSPRAP